MRRIFEKYEGHIDQEWWSTRVPCGLVVTDRRPLMRRRNIRKTAVRSAQFDYFRGVGLGVVSVALVVMLAVLFADHSLTDADIVVPAETYALSGFSERFAPDVFGRIEGKEQSARPTDPMGEAALEVASGSDGSVASTTTTDALDLTREVAPRSHAA
jgi:hypothetical protein